MLFRTLYTCGERWGNALRVEEQKFDISFSLALMKDIRNSIVIVEIT
jgi:hypothetical protein